jgi:hypothetical protein
LHSPQRGLAGDDAQVRAKSIDNLSDDTVPLRPPEDAGGGSGSSSALRGFPEVHSERRKYRAPIRE